VILGVGGHFVLATGEAGQSLWSVNDPAGGVARTRTSYLSLRLFSKFQAAVGAAAAESLTQSAGADEVLPDTRGFLRIVVDQCIPFLVTDPEGRRTGIEPATGNKLEEIPGASYLDNEFLSDPENPGSVTSSSCVFEVIGPLDGIYKVQLGPGNGTAYTASFYEANHSEGASLVLDSGQPVFGLAPQYLVKYSGAPGAAITAQRVNSSPIPALSSVSVAILIALLGLAITASLKARKNQQR
jgi:hypothetical protein